MMSKKHVNYDKRDQQAILRSAIPAAIMASEGTRFDSAEDASVFYEYYCCMIIIEPEFNNSIKS